MPRVDRLSGGRLLRPDRDHVGGVLLGKQTDIRRAGELDGYRFLAVIAEPIPDAGGESFVGDADVLADPETRNARERADRRLEDEAYGPRLALRGQLVVVGVEHDRLRLAGAEAVLEERPARDVVLEKLRETTLACAHRLVDGLGLLFGGLSDQNLPRLFRPPERFVLRLRTPRERVHKVRRRCVDVPLDDGAALHVHEDRARVAAEDVFVVAVDVVVALLARGGATLRQDPLRLEKRRVRIRAQVRKVDAAEDSVPVHIVALRAPQVLLRLANLGRRVEDAAARELLAHDEHPLLQAVRLWILRQEIPPERRGHEG